MSPIEYVISIRIERACELLRDSNLSIKNVAHSVGFTDCLYFSKVFKRIVGIPPTEYREKNGN